MPVFLNTDPRAHRADAHPRITVGVVNNMADEALKATERQYISLLNAASDGIAVHLSFYTLPGVPRSPSASRHIRSLYSDMDDLLDGHLDGLIVTGREPLAADLREEAYWPSFTRILEWAQENTHSTIWSCLAAHAAVLHLDGIERVRRKDKLFGVFDCERVSDHALVADATSRMKQPHSRWNGLKEEALASRGYKVLTRTAEGEIDTFIKQHKALFLFFQGHPEYGADTLLREYRRDVGRYCKGELTEYPLLPQGYFGRHTVEALTSLHLQAVSGQAENLLPEVAAALNNATIENTGQSSGMVIYKNWLRWIGASKENRERSSDLSRVSRQPMAGGSDDRRERSQRFASSTSKRMRSTVL